MELMHLGLTLDSKLNWNPYTMQKTVNKGKRALIAVHQEVGKTWGLNPHVVY